MLDDQYNVGKTAAEKTLRRIMPEVFTDGKVDLDDLANALNDLGLEVSSDERYKFSWSGRSEAISASQLPSKARLEPILKDSINFEKTKNVFIEGDNLEVLKILQNTMRDSVKMIYVDPPYNANSGRQFYRDDFRNSQKNNPSRSSQLKKSSLKPDGAKPAESESAAGNHSQWLSMMYPTIFLARKLLKTDGLMFVSIDDTEFHNLRLIMNEIFGENNVEVMIWKKVESNEGKLKLVKRFRIDHEYIIVGYRNKEKCHFRKVSEIPRFKNPSDNVDDDPRGDWVSGNMSSTEAISVKGGKNYYQVISPGGRKFARQWKFPRSEFERLDQEKRIYWGKDGINVPRLKVFANEPRQIYVSSIIEEKGTAKSAASEIARLVGSDSFRNPKPVKLMRYLIDATQTEGETIMDFFAGSGTTAQAVLEQNELDGGARSFILVQLPEALNQFRVASDQSQSGFSTIADVTKKRILATIENIRRHRNQVSTLDLGVKIYKVQEPQK
jgi:adenine-specific DNA-methyltransferase